MNKNGHKFIVIPYDLIIDTDVGLYKLLENKYCNEEIFHTEPLKQLDMPHLLFFLTNRDEVNPLDTIAKKEDPALMKEYYDQFFEKEYDYILRRSITTSLYEFVKYNERDRSIHFTLWVPSENIRNILIERDPDGFGAVDFRIAPTYAECIEENDDPIYVKDIYDITRNIKCFLGKTVYVANYAFNYRIDSVTGRRGLTEEVGVIANRRMYITTFDVYRTQDVAKIEEA